MANLLQIQEKHPAAPQGMAVFRLGFRPFYLLAALLAVLSIPAWLLSYLGYGSAGGSINVFWHMHEMVFGFAVAVVIGFLYTAGANWTGLVTPRGTTLAFLCAVWLAGRLAMLCSAGWITAAVDIIFLPCAAWALWRVLRRAKSVRNYQFVLLLMTLALCNVLFHLAMRGVFGLNPLRVMELALCLVLSIATVVGGRVIPMFTINVLHGPKLVAQPNLDRACVALTAATGLLWSLNLHAVLTALVAAVAAGVHGLRMRRWRGWATFGHPLLWILHLSYAWIPLGLILLACSQLGWVTESTALHALAVGAMAGLVVGMITRTALGHTGRPLKAGAPEIAMYAAIQLAAGLRVLAGLGSMTWQPVLLVAAATFWVLTFGLYLLAYFPLLTGTRADGKDG